MSDRDWPQAGPGVERPHAAVDGVPSFARKRKREELGSTPGPGSSAVRRRKQSRLDKTYNHWRDMVGMATFGKNVRNTVGRPLFAKNLNEIFAEELGMTLQEYREATPAERGTEMIKDGQHDRVRRAFEIFAADIRSGKVRVDGKDTWFLFYGRRAKYLENAKRAQREELHTVSQEIHKDDTWI